MRYKINSKGKILFQNQCEHIIEKLLIKLAKLKKLRFFKQSLCAISKFRIFNAWADSILK